MRRSTSKRGIGVVKGCTPNKGLAGMPVGMAPQALLANGLRPLIEASTPPDVKRPPPDQLAARDLAVGKRPHDGQAIVPGRLRLAQLCRGRTLGQIDGHGVTSRCEVWGTHSDAMWGNKAVRFRSLLSPFKRDATSGISRRAPGRRPGGTFDPASTGCGISSSRPRHIGAARDAENAPGHMQQPSGGRCRWQRTKHFVRGVSARLTWVARFRGSLWRRSPPAPALPSAASPAACGRRGQCRAGPGAVPRRGSPPACAGPPRRPR